MKNYPWYLYLISIVIGIVAVTLIMFLVGVISNYTNVPQFIQMIFPLVTVSIASVWAFLLPRKLYDKKHNAQP